MKILLIEPFYTGSHRQWVDGWKKYSRHEISLLTLPGRHWKWRMHGAAVTLARRYIENHQLFDVIMVSDLLDFAVFISLVREHIGSARLGIYFHENQLTYPWSPGDEDLIKGRDRHYAFINYSSCLAADFVWFNSHYHRQSFLRELDKFLKAFPDHTHPDTIREIEIKSEVKYLGLELSDVLRLPYNPKAEHPVILWNHRWEYDKNMEDFYQICMRLKERKVYFELIICGEKFQKYPPIFDKVKETFTKEVIHFGYAEKRKSYLSLLDKANVVLVTSKQDFFGGSAVEAMAAGCVPFIPNRLAYPEHIPDDLRRRVLYKDTQQVVENLSGQHWRMTEHEVQLLRQHIHRYDWSQVVRFYDQSIDEMCASN